MEDLVVQEFEALQLPDINQHTGGVSFGGDFKGAFNACLWSRVASRILYQLKEFTITSDDDLYKEVIEIDWSEHFSCDQTFSIDCFSSHSAVSNSHFAALRIKDAIVDQFKQKTGNRPDVEKNNPDIRLNAYLSDDRCLLYLDLSGEALHKRGYRQQTGEAPLRETLAAAMLYRAKWPDFYQQGKALFDPMCGSGTLLIEGALMAMDIAPGLSREQFGFSKWKQFDPALWQDTKTEAAARKDKAKENVPEIVGCDVNDQVVGAARKNIEAAGLSSVIRVSKHDATESLSANTAGLSGNSGLIITNPPYGKRIGDVQQLRTLYHRFGKQLKAGFDGWTVSIITSEPELAKSLGLRAFKKNTLYNGPLKSTLYQYKINGRPERVLSKESGPSKTRPAKAEAGGTDTALNEHAMMFSNRLKKNFKHLGKWARKNDISCYRVYDADIPQYAVAIDKYEDWVHVQEFQAPKTIDKNRAFQRVNDVIDIVADVLQVPQDHVVLKVRKRQEGSSQYEKLDERKRKLSVRENGLKFLVNMHDYIDTGLFLDHRQTRWLIRQLADGLSFLNLFAYTGSVSVYAAAGGASTTTTVDMSNTYLKWAQDNMSINGFSGSEHSFIRDDCLQWMRQAIDEGQKYELIFIDPPTFSNSKKMTTSLDISRDHAALLSGCLALVSDDGLVVFSTNAKKFKLDEALSEECYLREITSMTTTEDFRRKPLHRCWCLAKDESALKALDAIKR